MIEKNSIKAWLLAARPKTLAGAATPVLIGCAFAYAAGVFQWGPALLCFLFAFLMQIDANFINDLFDYLKGADTGERLGPERACAQGWITPGAMKAGILITTLCASLSGLCLLYYAGPELIAVGVVCVLFAFLYTAGPYPLAYHGWGDLLVVWFFGLVPVGATFYTMAHGLDFQVILGGLACGLVVDTLLMVNNYRDREQDAKNGKKTLAVRLGGRISGWLYFLLGVGAAALCLLFLTEGNRWAALLPQLYLLPHYLSWRKMVEIERGKELNAVLARTSANMLLFGLLLSVGLIIPVG